MTNPYNKTTHGRIGGQGWLAMALVCVAFLLPVSAKAQHYPTTLTAEERFFGLSTVWKEISSTFAAPESHTTPDPDSLYKAFVPKVLLAINDYAYYRLLQQFAASFRDANTYVEMPEHLRDSLVIPPIEISEVRGRFYVTNIDRSLAGKLPIGSEILRINGFETSLFLQNEILPYLSASTAHGRMAMALAHLLEGWVNTGVMINARAPDGSNLNERVKRVPTGRLQWMRTPLSTEPIAFERGNRDIAVITLNSFSAETMRAIQTNRMLGRAQSVILDLRNCRHEESLENIVRAALLFADLNRLILPGFAVRQTPYAFSSPQPGELQHAGQHREVSRYRFSPPDTLRSLHRYRTAEPINLPLVILVGPYTGNGAEHFLMMLRQSPFRAVLVGERTAGAIGGSIKTPLPGGGVLSVNARYDIYPDDMWITHGFVPDIPTPADIKSILNSDDLPMLKALEYLSRSEER